MLIAALINPVYVAKYRIKWWGLGHKFLDEYSKLKLLDANRPPNDFLQMIMLKCSSVVSKYYVKVKLKYNVKNGYFKEWNVKNGNRLCLFMIPMADYMIVINKWLLFGLQELCMGRNAGIQYKSYVTFIWTTTVVDDLLFQKYYI